MIQPRQHLRFASEAREPVGMGRNLQDFDRHARFNLAPMAGQTTPMPPSPSFEVVR
jgi:hypothetical protein